MPFALLRSQNFLEPFFEKGKRFWRVGLFTARNEEVQDSTKSTIDIIGLCLSDSSNCMTASLVLQIMSITFMELLGLQEMA